MKRFFADNLTIIGEVITLILASVWYFQNREIEPLILMFVSGFALLATLFFRSTSPRLILSIENSSKGRRQSGYSQSQRNPRDKEGNIILYHGGDISVYNWELHWYYTLYIRNGSSEVAYSPIIYTKNMAKGVKMQYYLDEFEPIQPQEKIEIEIKYEMSFKGTGNEADSKLKGYGKFPPLMKELELMINYKDEKEINFYSIFSVKNNNTEIRKRRAKKFVKLELPLIQKLRK